MKLTIQETSAWLATQQVIHQIIVDSSPTILIPSHKVIIFKNPSGSELMWFNPLFKRAAVLTGIEGLSRAFELTMSLAFVQQLQERHRASVASAMTSLDQSSRKN